MDEHRPSWIVDSYNHLWSCSEDFTAERHGLTVLTCPPPSCFGEQVIAVRDEYLELWDSLRDAHNGKHYGGLVLTGHTGTGKHCFILYAFARALKEHIPVAFCHSPSQYYFCDGTGCRLYQTNDYAEHYVETGRFFLALVGYSESIAIPPHNFLHRSQMCFTIQANSPLSALRNPWAEEREARYWVMSLWTEDEVRKLQHFYEQEGPHPWKNNDDAYYSPLEVFALLGPSIRKCFCADGNRKTAQGPAHDFQDFLRPDDIFNNVDDFMAALMTKTVTSLRQDLDLDFHRLFVLSKPYCLSNPIRWGAHFHHAIPTLFLHHLLSTHFRRRPPDEQVAFIRKLQNSRFAHTRSFVYAPAILDALCSASGRSAACHCHLADGSAFSLGPGLVLAADQVTADTVSIVPRDNHIYLLPTNGGLPWIDAFVISEGRTRVTMLQTTVNRAWRKVVSSAVSRVTDLLRRSMPNTSAVMKWSFVFVSPGVRGEELAKTLGEVHFRGDGRPRVVAGWVEVGGLLGYPEEVLDALRHEDAEALAEEIDDDAEPRTESGEGRRRKETKTTDLDSGLVMIDWLFFASRGGT